jgi:hypothetical protein
VVQLQSRQAFTRAIHDCRMIRAPGACGFDVNDETTANKVAISRIRSTTSRSPASDELGTAKLAAQASGMRANAAAWHRGSRTKLPIGWRQSEFAARFREGRLRHPSSCTATELTARAPCSSDKRPPFQSLQTAKNKMAVTRT